MEEIYQEYSKKVYRYLLSLTSDANIAEDLLQETFYSAIKNINKFRGESSMQTWLYKIAKNKWNDYYKKTKKLEKIQEAEEKTIITSSNMEEEYFNRSELMYVCRQVHKLDETSKEIFYLRVGMNFGFKEIANITGKTEENVRVIFYRTKTKLKEEIRNE